MGTQKDYDIPKYSQRDVWAIVTKAIVATAFVMLIWGRFLNVERNQVEDHADINAKIELAKKELGDKIRATDSIVHYNRERGDRKDKRLEELINNLH